jgi:hypothetical protein
MRECHRHTITHEARECVVDRLMEVARLEAAADVGLVISARRDLVRYLLGIYYSIEASAGPDY